MAYLETSALEAINIDKAFQSLVQGSFYLLRNIWKILSRIR